MWKITVVKAYCTLLFIIVCDGQSAVFMVELIFGWAVSAVVYSPWEDGSAPTVGILPGEIDYVLYTQLQTI